MSTVWGWPEEASRREKVRDEENLVHHSLSAKCCRQSSHGTDKCTINLVIKRPSHTTAVQLRGTGKALPWIREETKERQTECSLLL